MEEMEHYKTVAKNEEPQIPKETEAIDIVRDILTEVNSKFKHKNSNYANYGHENEDMLYNFRETARRQCGSESHENMIRVLNVLVDKHLLTLAKNGLRDSEFRERVMDVIVYHVIAIMIHDEWKEDNRV